tara:strand:+ start:342 stop:473 length:132 start_codon:yes stop_codon:yes gene_type:complete
MKTLIDKVIDQIVIDVNKKDYTAIEELLKVIPRENLIGFLSET